MLSETVLFQFKRNKICHGVFSNWRCRVLGYLKVLGSRYLRFLRNSVKKLTYL